MEDSFFEDTVHVDTGHEAESVEESVAATTDETIAVEDGQTGEKVDATPAQEDQQAKDQKRDPRIEALETAASEERRKRQEIEERYNQLEQRLSEPERQKQLEQERERLEDDFHARPTDWVQDTVRREVTQARAEIRREMSDRHWRNLKPDYEEKLQAFVEAARSSPVLLDEYNNSQDPSEVVYRQGSALLEFRDVTSIEDYRERVRKEILDELKEQGELSQTRDLPPTNVGVRQAGGSDVRVDDSLDAIFNGR